jgi:hypothetical protein
MSYIPLKRMKPNSKIDLWDLGPSRPKEPVEPKAVDQKLKGTELKIAEVEHEDTMDAYIEEVRAFAAAKREYQRWHTENGGPVKIELWGCDARHAMIVEPNRYKIDLPRGTKAGPKQMMADAVARKAAQELAADVEADPEFQGS